MGHRGHQQWAGGPDKPRHQRGGHGGGHGFGGHLGHGGPPPWAAALFGFEDRGRRRGPRVRRGDVRTAILDVLVHPSENTGTEPINGYQVIGEIAERSGGAWRPSPGSVYPTISQLEDEGLVVVGEGRGRRSIALTEAGRAYAAEHDEELAAVWTPFARKDEPESDNPDLRTEIGQVASAVWQIATQGSDAQKAAAIEALVGARRRLYGILAEGPEAFDDAD